MKNAFPLFLPDFLGMLYLLCFLSDILESWSLKDKEEKSVMCYFGRVLKITFI